MSISKQFYQHSGTIYRRSKSYLIVRISSDTVAENYGQVGLQFAMTTYVCHSDCWLCCDMHVDRKTRAALLKPYWHPEFWSSFINKHSLFRQIEAVVHYQIQQQTITGYNAELSLSNHRYIATWTLAGKISGNIWKVIIWGPLFALKKCGILMWSLYNMRLQHCSF